MEKIEIGLNEVVEKIKELYEPNTWHLMTINAVDLGDCLEMQWFFASYKEKNRVVMFAAKAGYEEVVPSIVSVIPSAWTPEAEMKDLLGANVEGAKKGLFLEPDMQEWHPLRKEQ